MSRLFGNGEAEDSDATVSDHDNEDPGISAVECDRLCSEFAQVTATNSALAMMFLQNCNWKLENALDGYFKSQSQPSKIVGVNPGDDKRGKATIAGISREAPGPSRPLAEGVALHISNSRKRYLESQNNSSVGSSAVVDAQGRFRLLSWNLDGLDTSEVVPRAICACKVIDSENPDVIFFQEVVPESLRAITEKLKDNYTVLPVLDGGLYFTTICVKKAGCSVVRNYFLPFEGSQMGRGMQIADVKAFGIDATFITVHLESGPVRTEHSTERVNQLKRMLGYVQSSIPASSLVFVGGDMNLRDTELQGIGGLTNGLLDAWESTGKRKEAQFTWNLFRNDNHIGKGAARFDRIFFKSSNSVTIKPVYFELVGLQRTSPARRFPSDHWGILFHADILLTK